MKEHIAIGSANVVVVGLARNCAGVIQDEIRTIAGALTPFSSVKFLVIESDSEDATCQRLEAMQAELDIQTVSLGTLRKEHPSRTDRIAICRNEYVKCLQQDKQYSDIDYVIVADLDGVNRKLTPQAVESCWFDGADWDACFANQSAPYYDIWALRHPDWSPDDCFQHEGHLIDQGMDAYRAKKIAIFNRMKTIPPEASPIRVQSAFGGFGIYKKHLFDQAHYIGLDEQGAEFCEHVSIHSQMAKSAKLYVVPSLINCGYTEHSKIMKGWRRSALYVASRVISMNRLRKIKRALAR